MIQRCTLLLVAMLVLLSAQVSAAPPQPFVAGSYSQLVERQGDKPFVISFWSLDCPPCYRELALWGEQRRNAGAVRLILISTDTLNDATEIEALLAEHGLSDVESWVFAAPAQQLRYEIDRHWRGELPRTYLLERGEVVEAVTGVVDEVRMAAWLEGM